MARLARAVVPGLQHHVTQRGNRRQRTFFRDEDYLLYIDLMAECCQEEGVEVWAYALMPNHAHLIAVPPSPDALRRAIGGAHVRYTREVNRREGWTGYLWQGRFASFPMDERHTLAAARYVELNPVRAALVRRAEDYRWSSARAHLVGRDDRLVSVRPLLSRMPEWAAFLAAGSQPHLGDQLHKHSISGRPLGTDDFVGNVEQLLGRALKARRVGRPAGGSGTTAGQG
jgi:putative transposase